MVESTGAAHEQISKGTLFRDHSAWVLLFPDPVRADTLFVSNSYSNTVEKFNSSGVGTVFASSGLDYPTGLAFDSAGNLYVANWHGNTIEKFNSSGVGTVFASSGLLDGPGFLAFQPIPEPSTWALLACSLTALFPVRRQRDKS